MDIKDKVIIITGASMGIGLAAARHLSNLGAKVVLAARSKKIIKALEEELPQSLAIVTDMKRRSDIKSLVRKTMNKYGRIDILINNAGQGMYGDVADINIDDFKDIMDLNLFSIVEAMQAVIPQMKKQGGGLILNISSQVTKMYIPGMSAYSSTKYALNSLTLIARQELEKDNISVGLVLPGMTATNFAKNAMGARPDWINVAISEPGIHSPELVAQFIEKAILTEQAETIVQ